VLKVTTGRAFDASIIIFGGSIIATLTLLSFTEQIWLGATLLVAFFILLPVLSEPTAIEDHETAASLPPELSTTAATISITDSPDVEGYAIGLWNNEIRLSQGAVSDLSLHELQALVFHEEAHLRYRHLELLVLFRTLWTTLGAIVLTQTFFQWGIRPLMFASIWIASEFLLTKAWLRIAEYHADQVAASRTSVHCYTNLLATVSETTSREGLQSRNWNSTHPGYSKRVRQLRLEGT
jgi:Zn-dependent protease with chaperone function